VSYSDRGRIRLAELEDAPTILSIYNQAISIGLATGHLTPIKLLDVLDWLESGHLERPFWVYEYNDEVLGWANVDDFHGLPTFSACVEVGVYVSPNNHRQGIGKALLERLEKDMNILGVSHLMAFVFQQNESSLGLFSRHGFEQWGLLPHAAKVASQQFNICLMGKRLD
jgi:phosphinothricin acetyltransferase